MAVLLRRVYEKSYVDPEIKGDARTAKLVFAADDATELVKELVQVSTLEKPDWHDLTTEVTHALRGLSRLESETHGPEKVRVEKAIAQLEHVVDPRVYATAKKSLPREDQLPAMTDKERLELAAQAVIAACRQAALFKSMKPGDDMAQAREVMVHMRLHYDVASDALRGITDKRLLMRLNSDVALATQGMSNIAQFILDTDHKLPWDRAFAEGFDAEQRFLALMGLSSPPRPYSGQIDPNTAIAEIEKLAKGGSPDGKPSKEKFASPQQAVAGIGVVMDEIYGRQTKAVKNAASDIAEPRLPKETSFLDTLLEILIKTALAGAAGAIGNMVQGAVKGSLDGMSKKMASSMFTDAKGLKAAQMDYFGARESVLSSGAASNAIAAEAAKDAAKEFFKTSGYKAIMSVIGSHKTPKSNSTNPLHIFSQHSESVLDEARLEGKLAFVHLAPALGQAEPGALWELYQHLLGQLDKAYSIQYSFAMEEWQNFKARMYQGVADDYSPKDKHLYNEKDLHADGQKAPTPSAKSEKLATSDAKVGRDEMYDENGALLVEAYINTDDFIGATGKPHVTSLRLPDAEDATLKHFREENKTLEDVHMNKHFKLKFLAYMNYETVHIGVGADHGFQESTLSKREEVALRVAMAGDKMNSTNYLLAMRGDEEKYSRFSVADIQRQLQKYIKIIQRTQHMRELKR